MSTNFFFWTVSCGVSGGYLFNIIRDTYDIKFDSDRFKNLPISKFLTNYYFNWGTILGVSVGFVRWYHSKPMLL